VNTREIRKILGEVVEAFGKDGGFVELTDDRTPGSRRRLARVESFTGDIGLETVMTNEVTYLRPEDHRLHEVLFAASNLSALPGPGYRPTDQLYLLPPEKMEKIFGDRPKALRNTHRIAERCAGAVELSGEVFMPTVNSMTLTQGSSTETELRRLAVAGARKRYGEPEKRVWSRLRRELSCIEHLGFSPYFLIANEAREIARSKRVPVTGRGSAANSLVAYCLGLTQPEPFSNRLLFERFLHEGRQDPPDIDLDLCSEKRDEVRDELIRRYDHQGIAVAATASTFSLRGAVRVAARALGHSPREIDRLARHVPTRIRDRDLVVDHGETWKRALAEPAMRGHPLQDRDEHYLLRDLAARLSGRLQGAGTHLGGLVIGRDDEHLSSRVPLEPSGKDGLLRAQYDKDGLEYAGIPKLDLLGLKMHTALRKAGDLISRKTGEEFDPYSPPPDDKPTYALIRSARNVGMFQLESPGQMNLSTRLKPRRFTDLVAQISLFRPGPVRGDLVTPYIQRRNGEEPYSVPLQELEEVLRPTYGIILFQETVLEVAHRVAGFSLAEADRVRRAMTGSRGQGAMQSFKEEFIERAMDRSVPRATASKIFDWMEGFSIYGFSAAHAASFAAVSYASAYVRQHHPAEFFCSLLNSQPVGFFSPRVVLNEARRVGIGIHPPDIHFSEEDFTIEDGVLRVGLGYCKGLSQKAITSILAKRGERPFTSVADVYLRTEVDEGGLKNLVKGGYLDDLPGESNRLSLLDQAERLPKKPRKGQRELPLSHPAGWWESREQRGVEFLKPTVTMMERMELETLALNPSRHPLSPYREALARLGALPSTRLPQLPHGSRARVAGLIECLQSPPTKSGTPVYFLLIEDEWGLLQATIFRRTYERQGHVLHQEGSFLLDGRIEQTSTRGFSFLVERITSLRELLRKEAVPAAETKSATGISFRTRRGA
jgi:error-prone DNA polymerase